LQPLATELGNDKLIAEGRSRFLTSGGEYARPENSDPTEVPSCVVEGGELVVSQVRNVHELREQGLPVPPRKIWDPDVSVVRSRTISAKIPPNSKPRQLVDNHIKSVFSAHVGLSLRVMARWARHFRTLAPQENTVQACDDVVA
jgi:hypothetical protein